MDDGTVLGRYYSIDDDSNIEEIDFKVNFKPLSTEAEYDVAINLTRDNNDDNGSPFRRA